MMKKLLSGLVAGSVMLALGLISSRLFQAAIPAIGEEYKNTHLFRSWDDPVMLLYFIEPYISGIILAWIWVHALPLLNGKTMWIKGCQFAGVYWILGIPGMLMSYSSFPLSLSIIISWTLGILIQGLGAGFVFSKMLKEPNT